jgi:predicted ATP-grasp superfamily ATP-dependent carboligase/GT2 family glycosyltransferase
MYHGRPSRLFLRQVTVCEPGPRMRSRAGQPPGPGNQSAFQPVSSGGISAAAGQRTSHNQGVRVTQQRAVVIASADDVAGLGAARALRHLDAEVIGIAGRVGAPASRSRAWSRVFEQPALYEEGAALDTLLEVGAGLPGRAVLLLTRDPLVDVVSNNRHLLEEFYEFVLPRHDVVTRLMDKAKFQAWAEQNGFPVPVTTTARLAELRELSTHSSHPLVVKPLWRNADWTAASPDAKAYVVRGIDDVDRLPVALHALDPELVVQQWVDGWDSAVHFCLTYYSRDGRQVAAQTGRKLLQWPRNTGSTAVCQTTDDEALVRLTRQVFEAAEIRGLCSLEIKVDRRTGEPFIIEPTIGRFDSQSDLATAAGQDLAVLAYLDACGRLGDAPPARRRRAVTWAVEPTTAAAAASLARAPREALTLARAVLTNGRVRGAYLRLDDLGVLRAHVRAGRSGDEAQRRSGVVAAPEQRSEPLSVSVVVCTYSEHRWDDLVAAVESVEKQSVASKELLVVVDHNPAMLERCRTAFPQARVLPSTGSKGLSGARNTGITAATGDVVAFLDDDARAEVDWLEHLGGAFADPSVIGAGGAVDPVWPGERPPWFPPAFDWVVGCSYDPPSNAIREIRNPIGANMSFRRTVFATVGGFREELGRAVGQVSGCEETELSIRASVALPGSRIVLVPAARVAHRVTGDRTTWTYFTRRCYAEGASKAAVSAVVGSRRALATERSYVFLALPGAVARSFSRPATFGVGIAQMAAVFLGVAAAGAGYGRGKFARGQAGTS